MTTVTSFGDGALLIELDDVASAHRLVAALEAERDHGRAPTAYEESVVGFENLVVHVDPGAGSPDEVEAWVRRTLLAVLGPHPDGAGVDTDHDPVGGGGERGRARGRLDIPVVFDGPDLAEVAARLVVTVDEVVGSLCGADLQVAFLGFSPGFPYLIGLPPALASVPRRARPRPSVPPGSVAVAGGFASVYPTATPGGWTLLGHTVVSLFDPERPPYARLRPGDTVRFTPAASFTTPRPRGDDAPPARSGVTVPSRPGVVEVLDPGLLSLMQDLGRRSLGGLGVPRAGPADPEAMRLANRLVGNPDDATVIEVTAAGPTLRFGVATHLTLMAAGGDPDAVELRVDGRPVSPGTVVPVGAGQRVAVGRIGTGLRAYLAVSGGFDLPAQLGSRSADVLCGLGPPPLAAGDRFALGAPSRPHGLLLAPTPSDGSRRPRVLRVLPGPHRLAPGRLRRLLSGTWTVGEASNRIGIRLAPLSPDRLQASVGAPAAGAVLGDGSGQGPESTVDTTAGADTIPSTGMVTGAVQVPPDGHPIILMPDHATVGGYPVACCVISADFPILGQLVPGDTLSLTVVDAIVARRARRRWERSLDERVTGWFPTATGS